MGENEQKYFKPSYFISLISKEMKNVWLAIDKDLSIHQFKEKPVFIKDIWDGPGKKYITQMPESESIIDYKNCLFRIKEKNIC